MSAIDQYKNKFLGFIECPSTFNFVNNNQTRKIAIYELQENIPITEKNFNGKIGDIIVGGGSGESPAFRISIPESFYFFMKDGWNDFQTYSDLFQAFWTPTQSYILCEGYIKKGWTPNEPIDFWLAENICLLLIDNVENYSNFKTNTQSKSVLQFFKTH